MLSYDVRGDIRAVEQHLSGLARDQVPFASALALTRTSKYIEGEIKKEIPRIFDRPTPYTLSATWVRPATKQRLWSEVRIKDEATKARAAIDWLAPQVYGGTRKQKAFENLLIRARAMPPGHYAVPAKGMPLDGYGNVVRGELVRMLSDLRSHRDPQQNVSERSKQRRMRSRTRRAVFYFSTWPPNGRTAHLRPGIYRRVHFGFGTSISPAMIFVRGVRYRKRLRFFEISEQTGRMRFRLEFARALREALATARPRSTVTA